MATPTPPDTSAPRAPSFAIAQRTTHHGGDITLTEADQSRFVQRVARAFESAGEGGQIRLRLSPPELGSLRMEVSVHNGVLSAHVEAETPQARLLLLDHLPALRDRLQEQNIKIERFDVDLMNHSPGGRPQEQQQRERDNTQQPSHNRRTAERTSEPEEVRPAIARRFSGGDQLNVVV